MLREQRSCAQHAHRHCHPSEGSLQRPRCSTLLQLRILNVKLRHWLCMRLLVRIQTLSNGDEGHFGGRGAALRLHHGHELVEAHVGVVGAGARLWVVLDAHRLHAAHRSVSTHRRITKGLTGRCNETGALIGQ